MLWKVEKNCNMIGFVHFIVLLSILLFCSDVNAFVSSLHFSSNREQLLIRQVSSQRHEQSVQNDEASNVTAEAVITGVAAPLSNLGHYAGLRLDFPEMKSDDNPNGTTLDFVLDTGANLNTINTSVIEQYQLPIEQTFPNHTPLFGSTTQSQNSGNLYKLGKCKIHGLPPEQSDFWFMRNLCAIGLPYASPIGHGILGLQFMLSFPAGIEFNWYGTDGDPPTVVFYFGSEPSSEITQHMKRIPLNVLPGGIMTLQVTVTNTKNGKMETIPALLDTGAPITILDPDVAALLEFETMDSETLEKQGMQPKIRGVEGDIMEVSPTKEKGHMSLLGTTTLTSVDMDERRMFVGRLPGLEAIQKFANIPEEQKPLITLGLDWLTKTYRMLYSAPKHELWVEPLKDQPQWKGPPGSSR